MTTKSVFYIITAVVLIFFFRSAENVLIEFVKASNQPAQSGGMFLMPPMMVPEAGPTKFNSTPKDVATR
jgi:hypothetical protein